MVDEYNDIRHTWHGEYDKNCPFGNAKIIEVTEPGNDLQYYVYLNNKEGVYYGFLNEGNYEYVKLFDFSAKKIGDIWDGDKDLKCSIIGYDPYYLIYTVKITEKESKESLVYDYSEFSGLVYNMQEPKMRIIVLKNPKILNPILIIILNIKKQRR